jgi:hypothetical protein
MKKIFKNHYILLLFAVFFSSKNLVAQDFPKFKKSKTTSTTLKKKFKPLTMTQTPNGKWVITDSNKKTLYEVFSYDNGPDYASEGLIRIVKNGKIGYADATNYVLIISPQFDCAFPFDNGKAKVSNKCQSIKEGEHSVWTSDAWQFVDKKGKLSTM